MFTVDCLVDVLVGVVDLRLVIVCWLVVWVWVLCLCVFVLGGCLVLLVVWFCWVVLLCVLGWLFLIGYARLMFVCL